MSLLKFLVLCVRTEEIVSVELSILVFQADLHQSRNFIPSASPLTARLRPIILHNVASPQNSVDPVTISSGSLGTSGNISFESEDPGGNVRRGTNQFSEVCACLRQLSSCGFLHLFFYGASFYWRNSL